MPRRDFLDGADPGWTMGDDEGSVTHWIGAMKAGAAAGRAADQLWRRYFADLVRLARGRLGAVSRAAADEEDVALSAFHSLCEGMAADRFPRLGGRDDLWRLLVTITMRKAIDQIQSQRRLKRGADRVADGIDAIREADQIADPGPGPDLAVLLAEECRGLIEALEEGSLRQIALLRMEGYTGDEIAERLGCNRRTVTRKLEMIRQSWKSHDPGPAPR
ncbi:MAG: hypothetical protein JWN86_176 [Planctomycetota bacterium]|nr:hypothetical protein [Planctomycetota bacterium]